MADAPAAPATPAEATPAPTETPAPAAPAVPRIYVPAEELNAPPAAEPSPAEPPATEPPAAAAPPPEPKADPVVSKGLALLTKREAENRKREEAIKAKEAEVAAREAKLKADDPIAVLEAHGFTYEQATEFVINGKKPTPEMVQAAEAKKNRDAIARLEALEAKREADRIAEQAERGRAAFKSAIETHVSSNQDNFECLSKTGRFDLVMDVVEAHWSQTGALLGADADDPRAGTQEYAIALAAEQVEKYLEDLATPLLTTKKFQTKIQPSRDVRPPATSAPKTPARTLSHSQAAAVPPRAQVKFTNPDDTIEQLLSSGLKIFKPE